ncbi:MAG: DUF3604 domain-containing protein [Trueperaceae bacterium]
MSFRIPASHPLHAYHRKRPAQAGRSAAEVLRQWGHADIVAGLAPEGVEAGSYQTVTLRFTVGSMGLDEDGGFKLAFRFVSDMGVLQITDPAAPNFVTASTNGRATIELQPERKGTVRPFQRTLMVHVRNATLAEGETVDVVLGDRSGGSQGWRQQTYYEAPFPVRVSVDPLGTHDFQELPYDLGWNIVAGPADRFVVNAPSFGVPGVRMDVRVKAEDAWGNPLRDLSNTRPDVRVTTSAGEVAVQDAGVHEAGVWTFAYEPTETGPHAFHVAGTPLKTRSNRSMVESSVPRLRYHWCDIHGQTGETVGAGTIEEYFRFGRHYAFLDGSVHQGNDFQIGLPLWEHIKGVSDAAYEPGAFVTFAGYEWSGTEAMGGDHNVIYHEPDGPIYRSSGWLDGNPYEENAPLPRLYEALRGHRAMTVAHVGGRPASFTTTDPDIEPLWEIHSAWGTFEWVYQEAFDRGFKIGFVANSDGHKCRPGASFPGAGIFGTLGGLTCVLSETTDRDGFWEALKARRTYATSGSRIVVRTSANDAAVGSDVTAKHLRVPVEVLGTAPIERVELLRGTDVVARHVPAEEAVPDTLIVRFGGARVKGRARMVRWRGAVTVEGNEILDADMHGLFSPSYGIESRDPSRVAFHCVTTGNVVNLALSLKSGMTGVIRFEAGDASFDIDLADVGRDPLRLHEAPLDQRVEVFAVDRKSLSVSTSSLFEIDVDHEDEQPYFVRVTQLDEGKAWTSPFYVRPPS